MNNPFSRMMNCALLVGVLTAGVTQSALAGKGNADNPGILPPQSNPHGKSYGEWAAAWWQWALSIPGDRNPLTDTTGDFGAEGQSGPVWFLAGTFGNSVDRSYVIPQGKTLLLPVYIWVFGAGAFDCDPSIPGVECDLPSLISTAASNTEGATQLDVTIDGVPVKNVRAYRAASPGPFAIEYPENSVTGLDPGTYYPNVADGYWLMLAPLPPGKHVIQMKVNAPNTSNGPVQFEVVSRITVQ